MSLLPDVGRSPDNASLLFERLREAIRFAPRPEFDRALTALEKLEQYVGAAEAFRDSFTKPAPATYLAVTAMDEALREAADV